MSDVSTSTPISALASAIRTQLQQAFPPGLSLWTLQARLAAEGHDETARRMLEALGRLTRAGQVATCHVEGVTMYRLAEPKAAPGAACNDNRGLPELAIPPAPRPPAQLLRRLAKPATPAAARWGWWPELGVAALILLAATLAVRVMG